MPSRSQEGAGLFVGREAELSRLHSAFRGVLTGTGALVIITGAAGIGKTRLVAEFSEIARDEGALVVWGAGWEGGGAPPLWPFVHVVRRILDGEAGKTRPHDVDDVARGLVASDRDDSIGRAATDFVAFDSISELLRDVSRERPVVVVIDDLHAADEASLELLLFLARHLRDTRVLLVGTFSETEGSGDPVVARHLSSLAREGQMLALSGLREADVHVLFQEVSGAPAMERVVVSVHRATEGNPFFVQEMARMFALGKDVHRPDFSMGFRVPTSIQEIVRKPLDALSDTARGVVEAASVVGLEFDPEVLARILETEQDLILESLDEAIEGGIVEDARGRGLYRFAHILIREALYERLPTTKRRRLHARVARVLENSPDRPHGDHVSQIAHHLFKADNEAEAFKTIDFLRKAAETSRSIGAVEDAIRQLKRAVIVIDSTGLGAEHRSEIERELAELEARPGSISSVASSSEGTFRLEGDYWTVELDGVTTRHKDIKGLRHLSHLLARPGRELHVLELVGLERGLPARAAVIHDEAVTASADQGIEAADARALADYRERVEDLEDRLAESESFNDLEAASRAREDLEALTGELARAVGLGGRTRREGSASEKARMSVQKAIRSAIERIGSDGAPAGRHLERTIRTGTFCSYNPDLDRLVTWRF
jgi:hypothetical protein